MQRNIKVSGQPISLTQNHYKASGGQADVFVRGDAAYKIYYDPKLLPTREKLRELSALTHPNIAIPIDTIEESGSYVGFVTPFFDGTIPLVTMFSNTFWKSRSVTSDLITKLVETMAEIIYDPVHENDCLLVDVNEYNFLVDEQTLKIPYFIDTDSYQTPSYPATAIMPTVRDFQANQFSQRTDWYSFAVVACQLYTGAHPYRAGEHPGFQRNDMEARAKAQVSIFNPDVSVSPKIRDFGLIPTEYRKWLIDTFETESRSPLPSTAGNMQFVAVRVSTESVVFRFVPVATYDELIEQHTYWNGHDVVHTKNKTWIDRTSGRRRIVAFTDEGCTVDVNLVGSNGHFVMFDKVYSKHGDKLNLIRHRALKKGVVSYVVSSWNVMEQSTIVYDGLCVSDVLGKTYFVLPFGSSSCAITPVPDLNGYRIIETKRRENVVVVAAARLLDGGHDKIVLRFDERFTKYDSRVIVDVQDDSINFAVLDTGVCIRMDEDDNVEISSSRIGSKDIKLVKDNKLDPNVVLTSRGNRAAVVVDNQLMEITIKM